MATNRFLGRQKKQYQVNTITPATITAGNTFTVTVNGKTFTFTATTTTVAHVVTGLVALLSASTEKDISEITWVDSTTCVTATSNVLGKPFTQSSASADGAGSAGHSNVTATTVANLSPNDLNDAVNWSNAATPANSDDVYFDDVDVDLLWSLGALTTTPTTLNVFGTYDAAIGLPKTNDAGYTEYRADYLTLQPATVNIGTVGGDGPNLFKLNTAATACTLNVYATGSNPESGIPCVLFVGTSASNVMRVEGGSVGVAFFGGETANLTGGLTVVGGSVICGSGVTLGGAILQSGGTLETNSALAGTVTQDGGTHIHRSGTVTALVLNSGTFDIRAKAAMTITDLTIGPNGVLELGSCNVAVTVTNTAILRPGAQINDPQNCLGRGGNTVFTAQGGFNSVTISRGQASGTLTIA